MTAKVAITIRSFSSTELLSSSLNDIGETTYINTSGVRLTEDELCNILAKIHGVVAGTEKFTRRVFESSPYLRVISRVGVGVDNIDHEAAREHGITILNTPNSPSLAVAEHTLALTFAAIKRITIYNENMRKNDFSIESCLLLSGRAVGIVGLGRVGRKVADMFDALGCRIYYYDPFLPDDFSTKWICMSSLNNLLQCVDIVTLHAPPLSDETPLMGSKEFSNCKKGTIIINTSRGSLIDERALSKAIDEGVVWGAGLDVFPVEPYSGNLLAYSQIVSTPHVASNTIESRQEMEKEAINNLINALREL
ncbi:NAD(P)-dependent oxidoreductase [Methanolobus sp. ZRKC5]|uniref:NAD(P)-dependent oxidoreductase n=1 Tax=unclassified Methanolobus TaxID=2629569 RepID=UPI00313E2169